MTYVKNSAFINSKYQKIAFRMESFAYKVKCKTETSVTEKESLSTENIRKLLLGWRAQLTT